MPPHPEPSPSIDSITRAWLDGLREELEAAGKKVTDVRHRDGDGFTQFTATLDDGTTRRETIFLKDGDALPERAAPEDRLALPPAPEIGGEQQAKALKIAKSKYESALKQANDWLAQMRTQARAFSNPGIQQLIESATQLRDQAMEIAASAHPTAALACVDAQECLEDIKDLLAQAKQLNESAVKAAEKDLGTISKWDQELDAAEKAREEISRLPFLDSDYADLQKRIILARGKIQHVASGERGQAAALEALQGWRESAEKARAASQAVTGRIRPELDKKIQEINKLLAENKAVVSPLQLGVFETRKSTFVEAAHAKLDRTQDQLIPKVLQDLLARLDEIHSSVREHVTNAQALQKLYAGERAKLNAAINGLPAALQANINRDLTALKVWEQDCEWRVLLDRLPAYAKRVEEFEQHGESLQEAAKIVEAGNKHRATLTRLLSWPSGATMALQLRDRIDHAAELFDAFKMQDIVDRYTKLPEVLNEFLRKKPSDEALENEHKNHKELLERARDIASNVSTESERAHFLVTEAEKKHDLTLLEHHGRIDDAVREWQRASLTATTLEQLDDCGKRAFEKMLAAKNAAENLDSAQLAEIVARKAEAQQALEDSLRKLDAKNLENAAAQVKSKLDEKQPKEIRGYVEKLRNEFDDANALLHSDDPDLQLVGLANLKTIGDRTAELASKDGQADLSKLIEKQKELAKALGELKKPLPDTHSRLHSELTRTAALTRSSAPADGWKVLGEFEKELEQAQALAKSVEEERKAVEKRIEALEATWKSVKTDTRTKFWDQAKSFAAFFEAQVSKAAEALELEDGPAIANALLDDLSERFDAIRKAGIDAENDSEDALADPIAQRRALQEFDSALFEANAEVQAMILNLTKRMESFRANRLKPAKKRAEGDNKDLLDNIGEVVNEAEALIKPYKKMKDGDATTAKAAIRRAEQMLRECEISTRRLGDGTDSTSVRVAGLDKVLKNWVQQADAFNSALRATANDIRNLETDNPDLQYHQRDALAAVQSKVGHFRETAFHRPLKMLMNAASEQSARRASKEQALQQMRRYRHDLLGDPFFKTLASTGNPLASAGKVISATSALRTALKRIELDVLVAE